MHYGTAQQWIGAMNTAHYLGFNDWRLPTSDTCSSNDCISSEMGHLFYTELGLSAGINPYATFGIFQNVQTYFTAANTFFPSNWSSTDNVLDTTHSSAMVFSFGDGSQYALYKNTAWSSAWAVRSGDVAAVPVPAAAWLLGSGMLGLIGVAWRGAVQSSLDRIFYS